MHTQENLSKLEYLNVNILMSKTFIFHDQQSFRSLLSVICGKEIQFQTDS